MGLLRDKMPLNMELTVFSPSTIKSYIGEAKKFVKFYNKSPELMGERCDECHEIRYSYNSCRNRHCPKCQFLTKEK
jgi:hypothetical protein